MDSIRKGSIFMQMRFRILSIIWGNGDPGAWGRPSGVPGANQGQPGDRLSLRSDWGQHKDSPSWGSDLGAPRGQPALTWGWPRNRMSWRSDQGVLRGCPWGQPGGNPGVTRRQAVCSEGLTRGHCGGSPGVPQGRHKDSPNWESDPEVPQEHLRG